MSTFTKKQAIEAVRKVKAQTRASIAQTKRDDKLAKETAHVLDASRHYDTLCEIAQRANVWHDTTYRKATDELYELLADCYQTTADIRKSSVSVMKSLNLLLKSKKLVFNEGTSLETKTVRVVFGDIGKRAQIYARVLRNAQEQSVEPTVFAIWLAEQGGVEAVRKRQKGKTPADIKAQRVERAEKSLPHVKAKQLVDAPKVDGVDYVLALVQHTNGKQRIVGFCENTTLIKEAMAKLADAAEQQANAETRADLERERRQLQQHIAKAA